MRTTLAFRRATASVGALALMGSAAVAASSSAVANGHGVLTGRVLDSSGEPLSGVVVFPWRKVNHRFQDYVPARQVVTDDHGRYRTHVRPGRYVVGIVPTRQQMFGDFYYATVAGRPGMSTTDYQAKPGTILIYLAFPGHPDSAPTYRVRSGHVANVGISKLRHGAMIRGVVKCPTRKRQSGLVSTDFRGGWWGSDPLDIHRDGSFRTKTPRPAGKVKLIYDTERCRYEQTVVRTRLQKSALNTLVPITKRPVHPKKRPTVTGVKKVGHTLHAHVGRWPRGTRKHVYWKRSGHGKVIHGRRLVLKRGYRGDTVRLVVTARKAGHFDRIVRLARHRIR